MELKQVATINIQDDLDKSSFEILDMAKDVAFRLSTDNNWGPVSIGKICVAQGLVDSTKKVHFFRIYTKVIK